MKVNLHSLCDESNCSEFCPSFRIVPMIMPDDDTTRCSLGDVLQDICTKALVRRCSHILDIRKHTEIRTCEAWITIRSFMRAQPASILPRRPVTLDIHLKLTYDVGIRDLHYLLYRTRFEYYCHQKSWIKEWREGKYLIRFSNSPVFPSSRSSCTSRRVDSFYNRNSLGPQL